MKRKFSLLVTIVVCLLLVVGILSACNDDSEQDPGVHVHSMELIAAKGATCTEEGNNAYYHCSGCNKYFKDEAGTQETTVEAEIISAAGHNYVNGECTVCGDHISHTEGLEYALSSDQSYYIVTGIGTASGDIIIPDTHEGLPVTYIGSYAFHNYGSLTSIDIPAGVTGIGRSAFDGSSNLESVTFAEGSELASIGYRAFGACSSLTSIEIPASVTNIGEEAFVVCSSLTAIEIPAGVTSIGSRAFYYCSSLTSIEIPAGVTSIGDYAFNECSNLASVTFAEGSQLTSIGENAFYDCSSLTSIELPAGVTSIGGFAFYGCSSLTSIEIPAGVTSIEGSAFSECSSLTSIEIPAGVTSIGSYAFYGCSNLASVTFAEGSQLTSIGSDAFLNCSSLTSIEIPAGVTGIENWAFSYCSNLETIYYNGTEEQWNSIYKGSYWDNGCGNYEVVFLGDAGAEGGEG